MKLFCDPRHVGFMILVRKDSIEWPQIANPIK